MVPLKPCPLLPTRAVILRAENSSISLQSGPTCCQRPFSKSTSNCYCLSIVLSPYPLHSPNTQVLPHLVPKVFIQCNSTWPTFPSRTVCKAQLLAFTANPSASYSRKPSSILSIPSSGQKWPPSPWGSLSTVSITAHLLCMYPCFLCPGFLLLPPSPD